MNTNNIHVLIPQRDETYLKIEAYRDLDRQIKALAKDKEIIGDELKAGYFLRHTDYVHEGRLIATYRPQIKVMFDQAKFKEDHAELFKEYQDIREIRVFLLK